MRIRGGKNNQATWKTKTGGASVGLRHGLQLSTALVLVLALGATAEPARAQSVTAENDVFPLPSQNPQPNWDVGGPLYVGRFSSGTLTIKDGGRVENTSGHIGANSGASGSSVTVSGTDTAGNASIWKNSGALHVGLNSSGALTIADGGRVESAYGYIGFDSGASGSSVTVSGTDTAGNASTWQNSSNLNVGFNSSGTLTIEDGGRVENTVGYIGFDSGASGSSVTVSGAGTTGHASTWHNSAGLVVGNWGRGTLTIQNGGKVSAGDGAGGPGTVYLGRSAGSGTLNIGTAAGPADAEAGTLEAAQVEFRNGNGTLNFNHIGATVFSAALESNGTGTHAVNHLAGTTTLTGNSSGFSGTTTVSGGMLLVGDAAGNGALGGIVNVGVDGTLGGSGTLTGAVTIDGTLSAGNSPGTLTFTNGLTLNSGSASRFELNSPGIAGGTGAAGNDLVTVNGGTLTLGGTLEAHVAAAGYYRLFDYSGGGSLAGTFNNGILIGTGGFAPIAPNNPDIRYDVAGQINLSVLGAGQTLQFWDGDTAGDGGGDGIWQGFATNWTDSDGNNPGGWGGSVGVFRGTAGTVTISGTQVFDTLQFSTDGYVVQGDALAIGVAGGGTFNIDGGATTTIDSTVQDGTGAALRKAGDGRLILTGNNSYSGGTSLLGGILSVASDVNLGNAAGGLSFDGGVLEVTGTSYTTTSRAITLGANGGGFDIADAGNSFTLAQDITGPGDLVKQGDGTLVLTGANDYGSTLVQDGTLVGNAGSISGDIGNAATVVFDQTGNGSFAGDIVGLNGNNGAMVKQGAGVLTLDGASALDWTIETGALATAADRFTGDAELWTGTSLAFAQTQAATYGGVLAGSGGFSVTGTGAVTLTGDSSAFAGTTTVTGNSLIVGQGGSGALGGAVTVEAGGLLGGAGNVGSAGMAVTIETGGVHEIASSTGTQTVLGDYVNSGTLRIATTPDGASRVIAQGTVDITGATLDLVLSPTDAASWNVFNGPFTIIDKRSAGAVTGTFIDPVTQNLLFLDTSIAYDGGDGNDVTLSLDRNDITFASIGQTRNQIATGAGVESLGNTNPVWASIAMASDKDVVRASFDALSGEVHASAKTALIEDSRVVRNAINDRIRAAFDNAGASYAPVLAYGPGENPVLVSADHSGPVFWSQGFGSWGSTDSDGNAAALNRSTGGLLIGTDGLVGDWRIGILAGYSHSTFEANDRASSGSSNNYHLGLYGGTQWGNLAFRTGAAYTWHDIETGRAAVIPGISQGLIAGYDAGTFQVFGELGYGLDLGDTRFEPFANLAHVSLNSNGFTEQGGTSALQGGSSTTNVTFTTLGLRAEHALALGTIDATLRGMAGWRHAFGDTAPNSAHAFATGDAFTIAGGPIAEDAAVIEAGLDLNLTPDATFGVSYQGQLSGSAQDHGFKANLNVRF